DELLLGVRGPRRDLAAGRQPPGDVLELDRGHLVQHLRLVRTRERVGHRVVAGGDVLDTGVGAQDLLAAGQHLISALSRAAGERRGRMRLHGTQPATPPMASRDTTPPRCVEAGGAGDYTERIAPCTGPAPRSGETDVTTGVVTVRYATEACAD